VDIDKALEASQGFLVESGPFYTGGTASPVGQNLPTSTFYLQHSDQGVITWRKYGAGVSDWVRASFMDFRTITESLAESNTTSTIFQTKVTETKFLPVGKYRIQWCFQGREAGANSIPEYRVLFNGAQVWIIVDPIDTSKATSYGCFLYVDVATAGNITWTLEYRNQTSGRTTYISGAKIELYRAE